MISLNTIPFDVHRSRIWSWLDTHPYAKGQRPNFSIKIEGERKDVTLDGAKIKLQPVIHACIHPVVTDWRELAIIPPLSNESEKKGDCLKAWCVQQQYEDVESYQFRLLDRQGTHFTVEIMAQVSAYLSQEQPSSVQFYSLMSIPFVGASVGVSSECENPLSVAQDALGRYLALTSFSKGIVHPRWNPEDRSLAAYEVEFVPI